MNTTTSVSSASINGTAGADLIRSTGDSVTISAQGGDDYVVARGQGSYIYGVGGNDTLILLPPLSATATASGSSGGGTSRAGTTAVSANTEIHGGPGNDDITVVHDSSIVLGEGGDDYITVKLYANEGDFMTELHFITLTGGDGRDTFSFNTSLPTDIESITASTDTVSAASTTSTVPANYRIEAVITDFSQTAHFCYDSGSEFFIYSILTDAQGNYTDIVLRDDAERLSVTLQGVTDIEDIVYATAVRFEGDSIASSQYLGNVISNYGDDMVAIPDGIAYYDHTVYVYDQYQRNVWLLGTDEVNLVSTYRNISARTLDSRNSTRKRTLVGNTFANVIYAGSNGDSLWGGNSANDTLYGGAGRDMFWYGKGDGSDCIRNFVCGAADSSDIINFYNGGIESAHRDNNNLHVAMVTGEELIMPLDYDIDTVIQYSMDATSISLAKVGELASENTFTYNAAANLFMGGSLKNTLKVEDARTNMIWLDGSYGQLFDNITDIDASEATGNNQIAGAYNQSVNIIGGAGASSLWGGGGMSNDTMTGGSGAEMFWYGRNEGNDLIIGASSSDTINLYNITLNEITGFETSSGSMRLSFENGAYNLTVQNYSGSPTFAVANGGNWAYENNNWVAR